METINLEIILKNNEIINAIYTSSEKIQKALVLFDEDILINNHSKINEFKFKSNNTDKNLKELIDVLSVNSDIMQITSDKYGKIYIKENQIEEEIEKIEFTKKVNNEKLVIKFDELYQLTNKNNEVVDEYYGSIFFSNEEKKDIAKVFLEKQLYKNYKNKTLVALFNKDQANIFSKHSREENLNKKNSLYVVKKNIENINNNNLAAILIKKMDFINSEMSMKEYQSLIKIINNFINEIERDVSKNNRNNIYINFLKNKPDFLNNLSKFTTNFLKENLESIHLSKDAIKDKYKKELKDFVIKNLELDISKDKKQINFICSRIVSKSRILSEINNIKYLNIKYLENKINDVSVKILNMNSLLNYREVISLNNDNFLIISGKHRGKTYFKLNAYKEKDDNYKNNININNLRFKINKEELVNLLNLKLVELEINNTVEQKSEKKSKKVKKQQK